MKLLQPNTTSSTVLLLQLVARLLLVCVFVFSAVEKAVHFDAAVREMQAFGLPFPAVTAALVIAVQAGGSVLLLLPGTAVLGAALLSGFTLTATLLAHAFWRAGPDTFTRELTVFLEHLGIIGGLMLAALPRPTRVP